MTKSNLLFWLIITIFVFFTRFYKLADYPPSLSVDEVAIGYNAYSILKTGRDEWGSFLPSSFRSVGDYKAPTLIYLTVPFVGAFGLNELGTRLPVAVFSSLNIVLFWLLVSRFIFSKRYLYAPYLATLIFTISPWLIPFSRSGFEAIVALSLLLANLIYMFKFKKSGSLIDLFLMFLFAILSAITYHSTRIVVPLLNIYFVFINLNFLRVRVVSWYHKNSLALFTVFFLSILIAIFFTQNYIFGSGASRANMTLLSKDFDYAKGLLPQFLDHPFSPITSVVGLISFWFKRYLEYFSANFYLSTGLGLSTPGHPGQGVLYVIEFPLLVVGFLYFVFRSKIVTNIIEDKFARNILTILMFISLLPASVTNNSQHALRTLNIVPVISILVSLGLLIFYSKFKEVRYKHIFIAIVMAGYIFGIIRFADYYTLHYPVELSETRSYGWKQMALYAKEHGSEFDKVYVDPRFGTQGPYTYGVPNMYFLFYLKYDPLTYFSYPERKNGNLDFDNYIFTPINWPDLDHNKNNLYIASPWSIPAEYLNSKKQRYYVPFLNNSSGLYAISDLESI